MFIIDTLFLSPIYATVWVARQAQKAVEREQGAEPEQITAALSELYMRLETGQITEAEFTAGEKVLLDRLDQIQGPETAPLGIPLSTALAEKSPVWVAREPKGTDENQLYHHRGDPAMPGRGRDRKHPLAH